MVVLFTDLADCSDFSMDYIPHPDDCTQYYWCVHGNPLLNTCPGSTVYNPDTPPCQSIGDTECAVERTAPVTSEGMGGRFCSI